MEQSMHKAVLNDRPAFTTAQPTMFLIKKSIAPGAARRYAPADGSSTVAQITADLRPSADGSAVRTSLGASGG